MERVNKGEKYWFISVSSHFDSHIVMWRCDMRGVKDDKFFSGGNYFHTREEAESMVEKIRKVLKGADVIEMPSEEECECGIETLISEYDPYPDREDYCAGFWDCINWLKSKIVK